MSQAIQKRNEGGSALAVGTFRSAQQVNQIMERAMSEAILVSPATAVGSMPEGCGIALTKVVVDLSKDQRGFYCSGDVYDVGAGKLGISKTVLQKIATAYGVSWDPTVSGRLDDGRDPYYCRWRAVGSYRSFDGQVQHIVGEKEMDLRDGSPQVVGLIEKQKDKTKDPSKQIREMRLHIQAHAESKAQLRAIRSLGIKTAYTAQELQKPFMTARVMWTGQTEDPALRRLFAEKQADAFLSGTRSLYGRPESGSPERRGPAPLQLSAPAVGTVSEEDDDFPESFYQGGPTPQDASQPQSAPEGEQKTPPLQRRSVPRGAGYCIPGGPKRGTPIADAETKDLEYWATRIGKSLDDDTSRDPEADNDLHTAMVAEIARREGAAQPQGGGQQSLAGEKY